MKTFFQRSALLSLGLGLAFAGCGGGGNGIPSPTSTAFPTSTPIPIATPLYNAPFKAALNTINALNGSNGVVGTDGGTKPSSRFAPNPSSLGRVLASYGGKTQVPLGVGDSGVIIGYTPADQPAVFWSSASATARPLAGVSNVIPVDVNATGAIVGNDPVLGIVSRAYYWTKGNAAPLQLTPVSGDNSVRVDALNASGAIVGTSFNGTSTGLVGTKATYWSSAGAAPQALPRLAGQKASIEKTGLNASGKIFSVDSAGVTALYSSPSASPVVLAKLPGAVATNFASVGAQDINAAGVVVGTSTTRAGQFHAVRWINGQIQDLNDLIPKNTGWELLRAQFVNDKGLIVGQANLNGNYATFYLTPRP